MCRVTPPRLPPPPIFLILIRSPFVPHKAPKATSDNSKCDWLFILLPYSKNHYHGHAHSSIYLRSYTTTLCMYLHFLKLVLSLLQMITRVTLLNLILSHSHTVQTELRSLKAEISHQGKKNFKLEKDLRFLDSKIALLINHKISIEVSTTV